VHPLGFPDAPCFVCTIKMKPSQRCAFGKFGSLAVGSRQRCRIIQQLLRHQRLRQRISGWASGGPAGGGRLAGEEQLGRCTAEKSIHYRLYLYSGKVTLAVIYPIRARVVGRSFAAALAHYPAVATPPAPAVKKLGMGLRRPCRGQAFGRRRTTRQICSGTC
jgi:hypothetical protein